MALKIRCPSCGASLSGPDSYHGKSIKCPKCNSPFTALTEEEQEEKERLWLETEKRKQLQEEERKKAQEARSALLKPQWQCAVCGAGISEADFMSGNAVRQSGNVYCWDHVPRVPQVPQVTDCPDCGQPVSKRAPSCPHCGAVFHKRLEENKDIPSRWWWVAFFLPFIGLILGIIATAQERRYGVGLLVFSVIAHMVWVLIIWAIVAASQPSPAPYWGW